MAHNRYDGNVVPFAVDATDDNRTIFGDDAQSDDINDNLNSDFKKGWEIVGLDDNPTKQDFNALAYTATKLISYLFEMGVAGWHADQNYFENSYTIGSNGELYQSLNGTDDDPNKGNDPTDDTTNWKQISNRLDTLEASQFLRSDEDDRMNGDLTIGTDDDRQTDIIKNAIRLWANRSADDDTTRYGHVNMYDNGETLEISIDDKDGNILSKIVIKDDGTFNLVSNSDNQIEMIKNEVRLWANKSADDNTTRYARLNILDDASKIIFSMHDRDGNKIGRSLDITEDGYIHAGDDYQVPIAYSYGRVWSDDETFTVDDSNKIDFQNADGQYDPFNLITLSDESITVKNDGVYYIEAQCYINTDQSAVADSAYISISIDGSKQEANGSRSVAGSSDDEEELFFHTSWVGEVNKDKKITFALDDLTEDKSVTLNTKVVFYSLREY